MISTANLNLMKMQTRVVMQEAIKASELFDQQFQMIVYQQFDKGGCVYFKLLKELPLHKEFELPSTGEGIITAIRHQNEGDDLIFKTVFSRKAVLTRHDHDCIEQITVLEGWFDVVLGSEKEGTMRTLKVTEGETIVIPIDLDHQFTNGSNTDSKINVKYIKP